MSIEIDEIRNLFPCVKEFGFFNTGTAGPLSLRVAEKMKETLNSQVRDGRITLEHFQKIAIVKSEIRLLISDMIGSSASEIAVTRSTSEGLNIVINGIKFRAGDRIITTNAEHITAYAPLYVYAQRYNLIIDYIDVVNNFESCLEQVRKLMQPDTKLICLSHISYCTGDLLPVREICRIAREEGIPVLIDGAQSFASMSFDVKEIGCDFFAAPGQKWACGPEGTGFLYVSDKNFSDLFPAYTGYDSVKNFDILTGLELNEDARKFESGTYQMADLAGFKEALLLQKEIGFQQINYRNLKLAEELSQGLLPIKDIEVINKSGGTPLIVFRHKKIDSQIINDKLFANGMVCRTVPITNAVRVTTGFYNTSHEIQVLLDFLKTLDA